MSTQIETQARLIWISGPPAAGKSTLAAELVKVFGRALIVPIDEIREWVKSGQASPVPWTEETERQYRLGEEAACDVAARYYRAGFTAIIDACRSPRRIDECVQGLPFTKILLLPDLSENLHRAHIRTGKNFEPTFLDGIIEWTHNSYQQDLPPDWMLLKNTSMSLESEIDSILESFK